VPAAARPTLAGCALAAVLLLGGCGGGGSDTVVQTDATVTSHAITTTAQKPVPKQGKQQQPASPAGPCQGQVGSFVASMDSLRRRLAVGLTYDQYVAEVGGIRSTYRKIPIDRVEIDCLNAVGTPAEKAFNRYIEAANDWGRCVSEAGCSSATVEPVLQRRWRIASHFLSAADDGLNAKAP
jgi:hypothetical protein